MATKDISDIQVLQAYEEWRRNGRGGWPYDYLEMRTGQCLKVCYRAMERACDRGLIEYGVSLRTGWLTPEGRAKLQEFTSSGCSSSTLHVKSC